MTKRQTLFIVGIALAFLLFDMGIYFTFTVRYRNAEGETSQRESVAPELYLPFDENSLIARVDTDFSVSGDLPVLDGAAALLPVYTAVADAIYPEGCCSCDGEDFSPESAVQYRNTLRAYTSVADGTADIIFVAAPSAAQLEYAEEKGAELVFQPIGREAFVFIVNENNPVDGLTSGQIRDIYSGRITNWSEVGGGNYPINALQRLEGSGSQSALVKFMGDTPVKKNTSNIFGKSLGFSFRYFVTGLAKKPNIKMLAVDGVYPDRENIGGGSYPVTTDFYAVYRADNGNENVPKVIEWILSDEGQELIELSGYSRLL
ncbi:MAG: substrate-binding domain-containing protein [Prevotella sp.]|nr:substrate-binding domain-containing protein [Prevotella sp.]